MEALAQNTYTMEKPLRERVIEILKELEMNKAELALRMNFSRSAVSQYGLSTLFQTNFFRLFFRYCTGV